MILSLLKTATLFILILIFHTVSAQDIKNVDIKNLSESEMQQVLEAAQNAGLSPREAANIARQKGATEQQIRDFENRISVADTINDYTDRPFDDKLIDEEQQNKNELKDSVELKIPNRIFGSHLFKNNSLTFEPSLNIQTPKNYEIGIGDEVLINIWGNSQSNLQLTVNKNGQLLIPDVGPIYIIGLTFSKAEEKIKQRLTHIYADMGGDNPGTFAQINMGQLRSIQINIVGEVETPGTFTLPVTATVFNALYLSGGPNEIGSFRNIKIIRNKKTERILDIYKLLIDADPSDNIIVKDNDIIFIPPAEKRVSVAGEFKRNGIFELKENDMLNELIRFAGGYTEYAYLSNIQVRRKTQQGEQILDIPYDQIAITPLVNGDSIIGDTIIDRFENRVSISGAVYRPGDYAWEEGMSLLDLILKADSLKPDAYKNRGLIKRFNYDLTTTTIPFDVNSIAEKKTNIELHSRDSVFIKSHFEIGEDPYITISGEIMINGQVPWSKNTTVSDVVFIAGGFTEAADSAFIEVSRRLSKGEASGLSDNLLHTFNINLSRDLSLQEQQPFYLEPFDRISVKRAPGYREQGSVTITGEVVYSGVYAIRNKQERISDLVALSQGITPQAFVDGAVLKRNTSELGLENIAINLESILANPKQGNDLFLKDGDVLHIPEFMQTVKINGSVQNPYSVSFTKGKKAKYYIDQCGGFDPEAQKHRVYVQHANGYSEPTKSFLGIKSYPEVKPGSQVIVPQKPEKKSNGQWLAIASVMASLAVSIATVVSLTR